MADHDKSASPSGVIVAFDGSEHAERALRWATREAAGRGTSLTIAHSYHWPSAGLGAMEAVGFLMDALAQDSAELLESAASLAAQTAEKYDVSLEIRTVSQLGAPVPTLVELSHDHELMVVGSRGLGGFAGMMLGSVSTGVVAASVCSVAVIRGDELAERGLGDNPPVVVGIDGDPSQQATVAAILRAAFVAAQQRKSSLVAVHVWQPPTARSLTKQALRDLEAQEKWHSSVERELAARVAEVAADFPDVKLQTMTSSGRTAAALLEQAKTARLVVVGTRGRGEVKGMLLGSTSRALVQHAPCPVLVIR